MTRTTVHKHIEGNDPHWVEWLTGLVSAVIVVTVVALIGKDALTDNDTSPNLVGTAIQTEKRSNGFQVSFEVMNDASVTASQVTVHGVIRNASAVIEEAETVLDYVPGRSKARGGLVFQTDPAGHTIAIHVSAFNEP